MARCAGCHFGPSQSNQQFTDKARQNPFFTASEPADARNNPFLRHDVGTANLFDETDPMVVAVAEDVFHNRPNLSNPDDVIMPSSRAPLRAYLTPILNDVWFTAPYLHDGSAPTLHDVVQACNSAAEDCCNPKLDDCAGKNTGRNVDDQHGVTSHLTPAELGDLVAFLEAPHGPVADDVPPGAPAPTLAASIPPELPPPAEFPDIGPPPLPRGHPGSLAVQSVGRFPTGMTLGLLSLGFTFPVEADGLVIALNIDEEEGVIQIDGASVPPLAFQTPAGEGTMLFAPRLAEGSFDPETGHIVIENVLVGLEFLGNVLPLSLTLTTGFQLIDAFGVIGQPIDEESGELILVSLAITPAGPLSPPIAIALTIEGILRGE